MSPDEKKTSDASSAHPLYDEFLRRQPRAHTGCLSVMTDADPNRWTRCHRCGGPPATVYWALLPTKEIADPEATAARVKAEGDCLCGTCGQVVMRVWAAEPQGGVQ